MWVCGCCVVVVVGALPYFLALQDDPGSSCIFPAPVLESAISPKSPGSVHWINGIRNQDLGTRWAPEFLLTFSADKSGYMYVCVYINPSMYTYLQVFQYVNVCICITLNMGSHACLQL